MNKALKNFIAYVDKKVDIKKFFKFGITGVMNTIVDFLTYTACIEIASIEPEIAQICAYTVATVNSYIINKNWTFKNKDKNKKGKSYNRAEIFKFVLVNTISMSLSALGIYFFHKKLGINEYLCKIPIAFITITINYFGNKIFVFKSAE